VPREAAQRLKDIHEAASNLHERLSEMQAWAMTEQGVVEMQPESLEEVRRRQMEMLRAIQGLAAALDTWVSMSQAVVERYLPQLADVLAREAS
jgi:hypothetical protein